MKEDDFCGLKNNQIIIYNPLTHLLVFQNAAEADNDPDFDPQDFEAESPSKMRTRPRNKLVRFGRGSHKVCLWLLLRHVAFLSRRSCCRPA